MSSRDRARSRTSAGHSPAGAGRSEETAGGLARRDFLKFGAMVGASTIVGGAAMADPNTPTLRRKPFEGIELIGD